MLRQNVATQVRIRLSHIYTPEKFFHTAVVLASLAVVLMGGPESPWRYVDQIVRAIADLVIRCSRPGCPDPLYPNKIAGNRTYRSKRERHCQKFHSTQVTVDYQGRSSRLVPQRIRH